MPQIQEIKDYPLVRPLTPQFEKMVQTSSAAFPGSRNITHFLEPSRGCANINCEARPECYAQDTWRGPVSIPSINAGDLYKQQFENLGVPNIGFFMSGYCEPAPENEAVRDITKAVLGVMIREPAYRPNRGMRFQTQSPMVVADRALLEQLVVLHRLMPFYVGVSAPSEDAVRMFAAAEELQRLGIEVQLCASPAKPRDPAVYARRIAALNPASVLYEPQHPTYGKGDMPGKRIIVPSLDEFKEILRSEGYKGPVTNKVHTFALLTPADYLLN